MFVSGQASHVGRILVVTQHIYVVVWFVKRNLSFAPVELVTRIKEEHEGSDDSFDAGTPCHPKGPSYAHLFLLLGPTQEPIIKKGTLFFHQSLLHIPATNKLGV